MKPPDFLLQRQSDKHTSRLLMVSSPSLSPILAIRKIRVIRVKNSPLTMIHSPFTQHLNRGSIRPPYLPSSFLLFSRMPYIVFMITSPPSTNCLDTIEPRFEPRARQLQAAFAHVGDTSRQRGLLAAGFGAPPEQAKQRLLCFYPPSSFLHFLRGASLQFTIGNRQSKIVNRPFPREYNSSKHGGSHAQRKRNA